MLNVAFITLLERKILGYRQYRLGPNKVRIIGILQPISDAIKLFTKQQDSPFSRNYILFFFSPVLRLILILIIWSILPLITRYHNFIFSIILLLVIIRLGVYPLLLAGWSSNRKYALLGGLRGVAQTISYEISLALILLIFLIYLKRYNFELIIYNLTNISLIILIPIFFLFWVVSCLAETNRTPFDFSEGESELVSGFNVEYGSGRFAIIFIAEYARIYFLRMISRFLGFGWQPNNILCYIVGIGLVFFWIWSRSTLPRFRYDLLIALAWKRILPLTLGFLELSIILIYF